MGSAVSASHRQAPPGTPSPKPLVVPYSPRTDNASGTGYRELLLLELRHVAPSWGKVSKRWTPTTSFAPSTATSTEASPALSPGVRSGLRGQLFSPMASRDLIQKRSTPPARRHRLVATKGPPSSSPSRAAATGPFGDRLRASAGFTTIPTVRPISSVGVHQHLNASPALQAPMNWDPRLEGQAARAAAFLV